MSIKRTEMTHELAHGLELRPPAEILAILAQGQVAAAQAVEAAIPALADAADLAATTIQSGGRLVYAAAGSSGLMALADALELPGTYGIAPAQVHVLFAGGTAALERMIGGPEDDAATAEAEVAALALTPDDCLIAITASGSTPYPVAAIAAARVAGARTIGISNNPDTPLLRHADVAVVLPTPPEVVAGSTRMGAGTAQKIALNMLSTQMAMQLGHVHDGLMVNVVADNLKLQDRARAIVAQVTGVSDKTAAAALAGTSGAVKPAILVAAGAPDAAAATALLAAHDGQLRPALASLQD